MLNRFLKDCKITRVANSASAATTAVTSSVLDMSGWDGVVFIALLGDVTASSALTLTVNENTANSTSSPTPTAVTGGATTTATAGASDYDNNILAVDVLRPTKRYVYAVLTRADQNAVVDGIVAIQYRARSLPVTQSAGVMQTAFSTPA